MTELGQFSKNCLVTLLKQFNKMILKQSVLILKYMISVRCIVTWKMRKISKIVER